MSAVRVLHPSEPAAPSASASRSAKRRRLNGTGPGALKALKTSDESAVSDVTMTSEDDSGEDLIKNENNQIEESNAHARNLKCAECGEQFQFATELSAHSQRTRHRPFGCQDGGCEKRYSKREHLTRHVETVHVRGSTQSLEERKPYKNVNLPFECSECLKGFKKKSELQAHSYRKHEANKEADTQVYVCDCGEICFDEDELNTHKQTEHGNEEGKDAVDGAKETPAHMCLVCDQTFARKQYLRAHLRTHFESLDDRKQYTCPMDGCNKSYTRKSNLMTHYNAVHDKRKSKRFACPREGCTARFGYKTVLKHHIESIHDNPKPPKRRERKSAGILERALGVNQVGEQVKRAVAAASDEEKKEKTEQ
ncbi:hypothetical protein JG687_00008663 [Phytophthora cactorum]|uniref:C2H2-type domain-containing protein n=1 Tax=Phytophthora cactorum TaxID=29920 RepID=A0A8T1UDR9_9STRA|nr:hypothetical protein JG687_00008663 [Phytophthora cactorum]